MCVCVCVFACESILPRRVLHSVCCVLQLNRLNLLFLMTCVCLFCHSLLSLLLCCTRFGSFMCAFTAGDHGGTAAVKPAACGPRSHWCPCAMRKRAEHGDHGNARVKFFNSWLHGEILFDDIDRMDSRSRNHTLLPLAMWERADALTSRTDLTCTSCSTLPRYAALLLEQHTASGITLITLWNRTIANSQQYSRCLISFSPCLSPEQFPQIGSIELGVEFQTSSGARDLSFCASVNPANPGSCGFTIQARVIYSELLFA